MKVKKMPDSNTWKEFNLLDFFEPLKGDQNNMSGLTKGKLPLISAKNSDNGLKELVTKNYKKLYSGMTLTLNNDGDGGAGISYFQPFNHLLDNHVTSLKPKVRLTRYSLLYISACITKQKEKFGHGYSLNNNRLNAFKIMLPVTTSGNPDWQLMSSFMQDKEAKMIESYEHYLESLGVTQIDDLYVPEWSEFAISDVFDIRAGKRLTKADMLAGKRPFIGATDNNNGITNFVSNENTSRDKNVLGVNYNGSVVETFYHPYESVFSDDVKRFSLKNYEGSKYVYLFLKSVILKQKAKYQYGYKFNESRMNKQKIILPVTKNGDPDYAYMEKYARNLQAKQLRAYVSYLRNRTITA